MTMAACPHCWEVLCECGYEYKNKTKEQMSEFMAQIAMGRDPFEAEEILSKALEIVRDKWRGNGLAG